MEHYDVIIIGSGAGGGTLAHRLAPSGKKILLLERGGYLPRELENWESEEVFGRERYVTTEHWYDRHGVAFRPHAQYFVGGNTKVYAGVLLRLRERDFEEVQHHGGVSPAWPITYADLEPYYAQAERLYLVHGQARRGPYRAAALGPIPLPRRLARAADPATARRSGAGRAPAVPPARRDRPRRIRPRSRALHSLQPLRRLPLPDRRKGRRARPLRAPSPQAPQRHAANARTGQRLEPDSSGRSIKRVVVECRGAEEAYSADIVAVSCGAVNSAALLLRSAGDRHPNGLANSSDVVGRHYMAHLNSAVIAISRTPNETRFQKTLGLNDYYWGADDSEFPLGHIQMLGKSDRDILRTGAPRFAPGLALDYIAKHALDFWLTTEDLPDPSNRVTVDRQGNIHLAKIYHNTGPHKQLLAKLKDLLGPIGCRRTPIPRWSVLSQQIPLAGIAHNCGTVRFGADPARSALDLNCKAHDLDNLYVVDASFFPSSSAVNPGLTTIANALRVGDHLSERLGVPRVTSRG